jgi:hypothetical protein
MSNPYLEWLADQMQEAVLERGLADYVDYPDGTIVTGLKNGERVKFDVRYDEELEEWCIERRELDI